MILKLTNQSKNFYAHVGKVFGSREVQRVTGDRFYDDDEKGWYIYFNKNGNPSAFVAVQDSVIKNVWSEDHELLIKTLQEVNKKETIRESVVPVAFKKSYEAAGFLDSGNGFKNFMRIRGDRNE